MTSKFNFKSFCSLVLSLYRGDKLMFKDTNHSRIGKRNPIDQPEYYDSKYGLDSNYDNPDFNKFPNRTEKNTINNKYFNKRTVGGS